MIYIDSFAISLKGNLCQDITALPFSIKHGVKYGKLCLSSSNRFV